MPDLESPLLTTDEAALYTKLSRSTLAKLRVNGGGPPFIKTGKRRSKVLYRRTALDTWLAQRTVESTAAYRK